MPFLRNMGSGSEGTSLLCITWCGLGKWGFPGLSFPSICTFTSSLLDVFFFFSSKQAQIDCLRVEQSKSRSSNTHNCSWRTSQLLLETGGRRDHHAESTHEMREHLYKSNSLCEQLPQLSFLLLKLSVSQQGPLSFISTSPWQQTSCHTPGTLG